MLLGLRAPVPFPLAPPPVPGGPRVVVVHGSARGLWSDRSRRRAMLPRGNLLVPHRCLRLAASRANTHNAGASSSDLPLPTSRTSIRIAPTSNSELQLPTRRASTHIAPASNSRTRLLSAADRPSASAPRNPMPAAQRGLRSRPRGEHNTADDQVRRSRAEQSGAKRSRAEQSKRGREEKSREEKRTEGTRREENRVGQTTRKGGRLNAEARTASKSKGTRDS
jgi:hypothetical protein